MPFPQNFLDELLARSDIVDIVGSDDLALDAALAESWTDDDAVLTLQLFSHILICEIF